jgi:hypothetical protein
MIEPLSFHYARYGWSVACQTTVFRPWDAWDASPCKAPAARLPIRSGRLIDALRAFVIWHRLFFRWPKKPVGFRFLPLQPGLAPTNPEDTGYFTNREVAPKEVCRLM